MKQAFTRHSVVFVTEDSSINAPSRLAAVATLLRDSRRLQERSCVRCMSGSKRVVCMSVAQRTLSRAFRVRTVPSAAAAYDKLS